MFPHRPATEDLTGRKKERRTQSFSDRFDDEEGHQRNRSQARFSQEASHFQWRRSSGTKRGTASISASSCGATTATTSPRNDDAVAETDAEGTSKAAESRRDSVDVQELSVGQRVGALLQSIICWTYSGFFFCLLSIGPGWSFVERFFPYSALLPLKQ